MVSLARPNVKAGQLLYTGTFNGFSNLDLTFSRMFQPIFPLFIPILTALSYAATNPIGAHGLPNNYRRKLFDGGMPCHGGRGICRNSSVDTPRHGISHPQSLSSTIL